MVVILDKKLQRAFLLLDKMKAKDEDFILEQAREMDNDLKVLRSEE